MPIVSNEMLRNEAASIVARYNVEDIFGWCKVYNDQHLESMDTILQ